jgi:hypothetical protein
VGWMLWLVPGLAVAAAALSLPTAAPADMCTARRHAAAQDHASLPAALAVSRLTCAQSVVTLHLLTGLEASAPAWMFR